MVVRFYSSRYFNNIAIKPRRCGAASEPRSGGARMVRQAHQPFPRFTACRNRSQGDPSPSIFKKRPKCVKVAVCHILTFTVFIFVPTRFYAGNFPYRARYFGPFRGWRRRGCLRHHLAVEDSAVPDFRGDFGVFDVL